MNTSISPNKSILQGCNSPALEKNLKIIKNRKVLKSSALWAAINVALLSLLLYDLSYSCPSYLTYFQYVEYVIVSILSINILFHISKIMMVSLISEQTPITLQQKKLLGIKDSDPNFRVVPNASTPNRSMTLTQLSPNMSGFSSTPMNLTASSWLSTPNESANYSLSSSWTYHKTTPEKRKSYSLNQSNVNNSNLFPNDSSSNPINDETSLTNYLKEQETFEKINRMNNQSQQSTNLLSSFWRNPVTKSAKEMSAVLRKCQYQLSVLSPDKHSVSPKPEDNTSQIAPMVGLEAWTRINVDIVALTHWNENLRKWLSQTILERLIHEFDYINQSLEKHGLNDIKIGEVGLDRLRKTAHMIPITQFIPSLATLIPFLEVCSNQEYLVKRIRELSKGGCMSDFKWNGGSSHNGKEWTDSLPTDTAIIMNLLVSYLDIQLMPLPSAPDVKPFSGYHYVKCSEKVPPLNNSSVLIHQVTEKPPHYRVILADRIYEMGKGYNNLFHSILFFLYNINKVEQGMMGRVNLGRAGINMLWIIDQ